MFRSKFLEPREFDMSSLALQGVRFFECRRGKMTPFLGLLGLAILLSYSCREDQATLLKVQRLEASVKRCEEALRETKERLDHIEFDLEARDELARRRPQMEDLRLTRSKNEAFYAYRFSFNFINATGAPIEISQVRALDDSLREVPNDIREQIAEAGLPSEILTHDFTISNEIPVGDENRAACSYLGQGVGDFSKENIVEELKDAFPLMGEAAPLEKADITIVSISVGPSASLRPVAGQARTPTVHPGCRGAARRGRDSQSAG